MSDHESYLFHGTSEEKMQAIAKEGFKPELSHEASRYGRGTYFADTSCKIHQYTRPTWDEVTEEDESKVHVMLYCRVALGAALVYKPTEADAEANFLAGMIKPEPGDPVFDAKISGAHGHRRWDSVDVQSTGGSSWFSTQLHREFAVFDADQIYPEYAVYYRTDTAEQEAERLVRSSLKLLAENDELSQAFRQQFARDEQRRRTVKFFFGLRLKKRRVVMSYFVAQQVEDNERRVWNKMQRARLIACAHADSLLERLSGGKHPSCYGLMEYIDMPSEESSEESSDDE